MNAPAADGDSTAAALRAVLDRVFAAPAYRWAEEPPVLRLLREWWHRLTDWLEGLRLGNPFAFRLFVFALLIVLALVLAHGLWTVWRTVRGATSPEQADLGTVVREPRDAAWYYREADRAASQGRRAEALQLAFIGLALTLDGQGLLRYHSSKTPAEYVREARLAGPDRERLRALVGALYVHTFGARPLEADEYRRWRADIAQPWHAPAH
ncbi:MAG TPA: DUF4129 domain-containing protein [Gemmatimonadales bacterium]|nr:DUF4129 domain-containing protein [Gemmatimonadales bacterium]